MAADWSAGCSGMTFFLCLCVSRCVEGSGRSYHHDRNSDRPAVVHLRLRQGLLPPAPPTSPRDARIPEEEARPHRLTPPAHSRFLYLCPGLTLLHRAEKCPSVETPGCFYHFLSLEHVQILLKENSQENPCGSHLFPFNSSEIMTVISGLSEPEYKLRTLNKKEKKVRKPCLFV